MNKNCAYTIKLNSDQEFLTSLKLMLDKYEPIGNELLPGEMLVIESLQKIKSIVSKETRLTVKQDSFINFRPYWEAFGGDEFLETADGQEIIDLFYYFAFKYKL